MMTKENKTRLLEAYFEKTISKEEMEFLLKNGTNVPAIDWIDPAKGKKESINERKRELISKVFGRKFPKIVWISTK
jgi:hypothetical protein